MMITDRARTGSHNIVCANCGGVGHIYKTCNQPIISYGVMCFRVNRETLRPEYLMVQRKDSLGYVEFLRGKYDIANLEYIRKLLGLMNHTERERLMTQTFDALWSSMWCRDYSASINKEFKDARRKFVEMQHDAWIRNRTGDVNMVNLRDLMDSTSSPFTDTEWGFPKGRRNVHETDLECAIREFAEETGLDGACLDFVHKAKTFEEVFTGSNARRYKHVYYFAQVAHDRSAPPYASAHQCSEIKDVAWFEYEDAQSNIRSCNVERKELFRRMNDRVARLLNQKNKSDVDQQQSTAVGLKYSHPGGDLGISAYGSG